MSVQVEILQRVSEGDSETGWYVARDGGSVMFYDGESDCHVEITLDGTIGVGYIGPHLVRDEWTKVSDNIVDLKLKVG